MRQTRPWETITFYIGAEKGVEWGEIIPSELKTKAPPSPSLNWCCWEGRDPLWPSQFSAPWDHSPGWRFLFSRPCQMEPPSLWLLKTVELVYRRLMDIYVPSALWHIVWWKTNEESWILIEIIKKWQSLKGNALWVWRREELIGKHCNHEKGKTGNGIVLTTLGNRSPYWPPTVMHPHYKYTHPPNHHLFLTLESFAHLFMIHGNNFHLSNLLLDLTWPRVDSQIVILGSWTS